MRRARRAGEPCRQLAPEWLADLPAADRSLASALVIPSPATGLAGGTNLRGARRNRSPRRHSLLRLWRAGLPSHDASSQPDPGVGAPVWLLQLLGGTAELVTNGFTLSDASCGGRRAGIRATR